MLGQGGMGAVYRATDPNLDRFVAIKVLTHREARYVERFRREAQVLARIQHPSIIQIYEIVGTDEDQHDPYIVMEYFEGKSLDGMVKVGPLPQPKVVGVLRQVAEGLKRAHANNVIHRDIKPANVMLSDAGDAKILDFGIAKALDAKKDLTGNTVLGTPYYMAPEQAMGMPIDARSDVYSLGVTAFHLLTGRRPFEARSKVDVMLAQVKHPLPKMTEIVPELDGRLVAVVEKMCAKKPAERYQNCQELLEALETLPANLGGRAPAQPALPERTRILPSQVPTPARTTQRTAGTQRTPPRPDVRRGPPRGVPRSRTALAVAAGAAGGVIVLGLVAFLVLRQDGSRPGGRVPQKGWTYPGAPAPPLKRVQESGYGNCVFSSEPFGKDEPPTRAAFNVSEAMHARCFFPRALGPVKHGDVWQELWLDGQKRAQILYDRLRPGLEALDVDLDLSRLHGARLADLSAGKHTLSVWIYRQPEGTENPEPLAAGEVTVRK